MRARGSGDPNLRRDDGRRRKTQHGAAAWDDEPMTPPTVSLTLTKARATTGPLAPPWCGRPRVRAAKRTLVDAGQLAE
jgi:hypothetical protein